MNEILKHEFLTVADVKEYLNVSMAQAYSLVHRADFPISRFGGSIRVPRDLFLAWVERNTTIPAGMMA